MKTFSLLLVLITLSYSISTAQILKFQGTENKTTALLFPSNIIHADLGIKNDNIAISIDEIVPNLLKLRLTSDFNITTNLLVVTLDESVYSFEIAYSDTLTQLVHNISKKDAINFKPLNKQIQTPVIHHKDSLSDSQIQDMIRSNKNYLTRSEIVKNGKMRLLLKNIFIHNDYLYFYLEITNKSNLKYEVNFYNLFMTSNLKKSFKGTTSQDIQISFDYSGTPIKIIPAKSTEYITIRTKKFTLEDDKIGCLEIYEKEGARHLKIKISNLEILSATPLKKEIKDF